MFAVNFGIYGICSFPKVEFKLLVNDSNISAQAHNSTLYLFTYYPVYYITNIPYGFYINRENFKKDSRSLQNSPSNRGPGCSYTKLMLNENFMD